MLEVEMKRIRQRLYISTAAKWRLVHFQVARTVDYSTIL